MPLLVIDVLAGSLLRGRRMSLTMSAWLWTGSIATLLVVLIAASLWSTSGEGALWSAALVVTGFVWLAALTGHVLMHRRPVAVQSMQERLRPRT